MIKRIINKIALFIWQLPQTILALALYLVWRKRISHSYSYRGKLVFVFSSGSAAAVSLGEIIFVFANSSPSVLDHEYGHSVQSLIFGPLYLLVIGIPSFVFCYLWDILFHKNWTYTKRTAWYHNRYPENWADKLGYKKI